MRLSEDKIRRIAERVNDELETRGLVKYTGSSVSARPARIKVIYDLIIADMRIESEIDDEVDKVLTTYSRTLKATEQDVLRRKHKEEIARRRGFEL